MTSDIETTKTVVAIQGISVEASVPSNGDVLTYVATDEQWQPKSISQIDGYGTNEFTDIGTIVNFVSTENILGVNTAVPVKEFTGEAVPNGSTQNLLASYVIPTGVQKWDVSILGIDTNNGSNIYKGDLSFITTNQTSLSMLPTGPSPSNVITNGSASSWLPIATTSTGFINIYGNGATGTYWGINGKVQHLSAPYAVFSPLNISDCILWLRPDMGITISTGVSSWIDQSTAGNSVYQSSSGEQPTFNSSNSSYSNKPTLDFNGSQTMFSSSGNTYGSPYTSIIVGHWISSASGNMISVNQALQVADFYAISNTEVGAYAGTPPGGLEATIGSIVVPCVFAIAWNGASSAIYQNNSGTPAATGDAGSGTWYPIQIGGNYGGPSFVGSIAEVIGYSRLLTTTELHEIFSYLGARYGISAS